MSKLQAAKLKARLGVPREETAAEKKLRLAGYIPSQEAAKLLSVHIATIYRWVESGELKSVKFASKKWVLKAGLAKVVGPDVAEILLGIPKTQAK